VHDEALVDEDAEQVVRRRARQAEVAGDRGGRDRRDVSPEQGEDIECVGGGRDVGDRGTVSDDRRESDRVR